MDTHCGEDTITFSLASQVSLRHFLVPRGTTFRIQDPIGWFLAGNSDFLKPFPVKGPVSTILGVVGIAPVSDDSDSVVSVVQRDGETVVDVFHASVSRPNLLSQDAGTEERTSRLIGTVGPGLGALERSLGLEEK